jgi:serine protease inhibitor
MHKNLTLLGILAGLVFAGIPVKSEPTNAVSELIQGNNVFAFDLYGKLKSREGNLFFSPLSISTCLGMTYAGARGETEKQMAQVLHFGTNQPLVHAQFKQLLNDFAEKASGLPENFMLTSRPPDDDTNTNNPVLQEYLKKSAVMLPTPVKVELANALYTQKEQPLLPPFQEVVSRSYRAPLKQVDFRNEGVAVSKEINKWIAEKTSDKIPGILQPTDLNAQTRMVLINTLYFKGQWEFPFDRESTTQHPFMIAQNQSKEVRMMHKNEIHRYYEAEDFQALEMAYADHQSSMLILLPGQQDGLKALEAKLGAESLARVTSGMRGRHVDVFMPKFKLRFDAELSECLKAMRMKDAFGEQADFSGMDGTKELYISGAFHKAFADVNEEGTEAAAVTALTVINWAEEAPPPIFRADHPFVFFIRDMKSNSILFMGRVMDPTQ